MKLYIWNSPYAVKWGQSFLVVCAASEDQARELAKSSRHVNYSAGPTDGEISIDDLGPPDAVMDAPAAVCYEWSE